MKIPRVLIFYIFLFLHERVNAFTEMEDMMMVMQGCKSVEPHSPSLRLKRYLFCVYDSTLRPTHDHRTVTNVTMKLMPKLLEFDSWLSRMTLHSWLTLSWSDSHLTWNPNDYDGITYIHINSNEIWVPDLSVYNSGDLSLEQTGIPTTNCLLYNTSLITCVPSIKYTSKCSTDFINWPNDKHECRIRLGSWAHTGEEVNFYFEDKGYLMDGYTNNSEWDLEITKAVKVVIQYPVSPNDTFPQIIYTFSLQRHVGILSTTFVTPALALTLLTLTVLWLDSRSTERIAVASVNFICHLICILDLHWQLPHNGANPPSILLFYRDSLALAAFSLILTALLRKLQSMKINAPAWISATTSFVLSNKAGRFLVLTDEEGKVSTGILSNEIEENSEHQRLNNPPAKDSSWRHFAAIVEWLSFFCVVFTYIVIFFTLVPSK